MSSAGQGPSTNRSVVVGESSDFDYRSFGGTGLKIGKHQLQGNIKGHHPQDLLVKPRDVQQTEVALKTPYKKIPRDVNHFSAAASRSGPHSEQQEPKRNRMSSAAPADTDSEHSDESASSSVPPPPTAGSATSSVFGSNKPQRWSKFVRNLYEMTMCTENNRAIGFSEDGLCLEVRDPKLLSRDVLNRYFKHNNVSSFIRQLNNYGFRTIPLVMNRSITHCFAHEFFIRDRLDLLAKVRRRVPGAEANANSQQESQILAQNAEMEARIAQLTRMNEQLKRQNFELFEENKRLRMGWRSAQEHHVQYQPQQRSTHASHQTLLHQPTFELPTQQQSVSSRHAAAAAHHFAHPQQQQLLRHQPSSHAPVLLDGGGDAMFLNATRSFPNGPGVNDPFLHAQHAQHPQAPHPQSGAFSMDVNGHDMTSPGHILHGPFWNDD